MTFKDIAEMTTQEIEQELSEIEDALDLVDRKYIKDEVLVRHEILLAHVRSTQEGA